MNSLSTQLNELAESLMDSDQVSHADICYEASLVLANLSTEVIPRKSKVSDDKVIETLLDDMALQLSIIIGKYVPEDEQEQYIELLLKYEEYIND